MEKKLNTLLSDTVVEYHKLQNFHWYAKGRTFYTVHEKLEEIFDSLLVVIDEVAETMLMMEMKPAASLKEFLAMAKISEAPDGSIATTDIYTHVLADFEYFKASVIDIKKSADSEENYMISALMDGYIAQFAKNIWMIKQVLNS